MKPWIPDILPLKEINWSRFIRLIGSSNAELARYDGILQGIINPAVLLSPLTLQEAVLSSRIEGTQATLGEVLEFEASPDEKHIKYDDIREIINYRLAMWHAIKWLEKKPVTLNMLLEIHSILLDSVRGKNKRRGEFRRLQNWIGKPGTTIEEARFVPPDYAHLKDGLDNLEKYIHYDEQDRLVQLAIIHGQFEILHPFLDGNGRIGRTLIPLFLYEKKMINSPMFYISKYLEENRDKYSERLYNITNKGDWESWIEFFLTAIFKQAIDNNKKAKEILGLYELMKKKISNIIQSKHVIQAIDTLFFKPVFSTTEFLNFSKIPQRTTSRILKALREEKIIKKIREAKGRSPALMVFPKLIEIAED